MENSSSPTLDGAALGRAVGDPGWAWPEPDREVTPGDAPGDAGEGGYADIPEGVWREVVQALLEAIEPPAGGRELWQLSDQDLLAELEAALRTRARVEARWLTLLGEAERRQACAKEHGLSTAGWLVHRTTHSPRRARHDVALARALQAQPAVGGALGEGRLSPEQADVISHGLNHLPDTLGAAERDQVTALMLTLAGEYGPVPLRRLLTHAVEVIAPEVAEEADRRAVERAEQSAQRSRYLSWHRDLDGGLLLHGKLTAADGERFETLITAHAARHVTSQALHDDPTPWAAACADALTTILTHHSNHAAAPRHGGDRPRIIITLNLHTLTDGIGTATLLGSGEPITAATARRLACDAGIIPAVLDGPSQPLDLGREQRLFTGPLRHALILRDQGCAFPHCDRPPADCDGHHLTPWWNGGETKLSNGVLLCQPHHTLIEPDPRTPPHTQWQARLDHHGHPEFLAPLRPGQHPDHRDLHQHHRYRLRRERLDE